MKLTHWQDGVLLQGTQSITTQKNVAACAGERQWEDRYNLPCRLHCINQRRTELEMNVHPRNCVNECDVLCPIMYTPWYVFYYTTNGQCNFTCFMSPI